MTNAYDPGHIDWHLAEQHFTGTPDQLAAELDELILKLVAYRHSLDNRLSTAAPRPVSRWHRFRTVREHAWHLVRE